MTALGLITAVPAVLAYNWLLGRNKNVMKDLTGFANDVHAYMVSGGAVRPTTGLTRPTTAPTKVAATASGVQTKA